MAIISSPNMNLPVPVVGDEPGPNYATDVNNSLGIIDGHTHAPGSGVPITPDAININTALSLSGNFAIDVAGITLTAQGSTPGVSTIYESGVDLFYVDGLGNNIQITANGGIAGAPGSISNLSSPASAAYVAGSSTFVWESNTSIAANMDFGAAVFRNLSPNSTFGLTVKAPTALSADYALTLPLPPSVGPTTSPAFMTMDSSGNMATSLPTSKGITASNIADATITATQISGSANIIASQLSPTADILLAQLNSAVLQWNTAVFSVPYLTFTIGASTVSAGATYTQANNTQTYTVVNSIAGTTQLLCSCTTGAAPPPTGTLTRTSGAGTGPATLTYSLFVPVSNESFTVPANVNLIYAVGVGGAGGGGVGATGGAGANGGGGAGGSGNIQIMKAIPVTPGAVLSVIVGAGGAGGNLTTITGATGGNTILNNATYFPGAPGGHPGAYNSSADTTIAGRGGLGNEGGIASTGAIVSASGNGGNNSSATVQHFPASFAPSANAYTYGPTYLASVAGTAGGSVNGFSGGSAGTLVAATGGGGGGGGASDFSNGAPGQNGNSNSPAANGGTAAGGGGGSGDAGGFGGAGGRGQLTIYWLGHA